MRIQIGADPLHGFVHTITGTAANRSEVKEAPNLLREDDLVVYGDAGYCKLERYVVDGVARRYEINRQHGTFRRHYNDSISWKEERKLENRKASVRCKVEYVFHIVKESSTRGKHGTGALRRISTTPIWLSPVQTYICSHALPDVHGIRTPKLRDRAR